MTEVRIEDEHIPLARMLYRAGAWMSNMDYDGGEAAQIREKGVIVATLERMKSDPSVKSLRPALYVATKAQHLWGQWEVDLLSFPQECKNLLGEDFATRRAIYMLAYKVAIAFREKGLLKTITAFVRGAVRNVEGTGAVLSKDDYVRISAAEKVALNELAEILNLPDFKIP
jgi:hypothetical protein